MYSSLFFKYKLAESQVPVERREVVAVSAAVTASACVKVSHQTRSPSSPVSRFFSAAGNHNAICSTAAVAALISYAYLMPGLFEKRYGSFTHHEFVFIRKRNPLPCASRVHIYLQRSRICCQTHFLCRCTSTSLIKAFSAELNSRSKPLENAKT